jgi:isopentenyl-diphosphate delta-isomerase
MAKVTQTSNRKADHIRINTEEDVRSGLQTGLDRLLLPHQALPEIDLASVETGAALFGRRLNAPLLISSMTGGTEHARQINAILAEAAQAHRVAMGLGSQRAAIENPELQDTFKVRHLAPDILLFANLGAVQLNYGYTVDQCRAAVEMIGADALVLHLNALQEALQPEGDANFAGLLTKIEGVCRQLEVPVIAKEVGWGISGPTAKRLAEVGVAAIDIAGAGGTSWSQVEMHRATSDRQARLAASFIRWGIPTTTALRQVRMALPDMVVIASGGLRDGIDIAKCLALGADLAGLAGPFLRAAAQSPQAVSDMLALTIDQLRVSMFACGCHHLAGLRRLELEVIP